MIMLDLPNALDFVVFVFEFLSRMFKFIYFISFLVGEMLIEPSEGVAANTTFKLSATEGWSVDEEDGPLVYRCVCNVNTRRGKIQKRYFGGFSEKDSCEIKLPPGNK
jgi:hypothetical protein